MADARFPLSGTDDILACPGLASTAAPAGFGASPAAGRAAVAHARTVLTMSHEAELLLPGRRAGRVSYVEDAGRPYLLLRNGPPIAADTVALRIASLLPEASELVVIAQLGEPGLAHSPRLTELMANHRTCGRRERSTGLFRLVPLIPRTVLLPSGGKGDRPVVLDLDSFLTADIDPYDVIGEELARHLTVSHQGLLRSLLPADAQVDLAASVASDVSAAGLTVRAISAEGSAPYRIRFAVPARHPHHFASLLAAGVWDQSTSAE
jgi:hypothetical protein